MSEISFNTLVLYTMEHRVYERFACQTCPLSKLQPSATCHDKVLVVGADLLKLSHALEVV